MTIGWHWPHPNSPAADFRSNVMAAGGIISDVDADVNNSKRSQN